MSTISKATLPNEPVAVVHLMNKKRKFKPGESLDGDDDWLDGLTVVVRNKSEKPITHLHVHLTFLRPENHETADDPPLGYDLRFNPSPLFPEYALRDKSVVIKPDETFELTLPDEHYEHIRRLLNELNYPAVIKRVEMMIKTVGFEDGTVWSGGSIFRPDHVYEVGHYEERLRHLPIYRLRPDGEDLHAEPDFLSGGLLVTDR